MMLLPLRPGRPAPGGFTLVEIMIVVSIIGLILAIALPQFAKSRAQATKQVCIENLSQIESAKQIWGIEHGKTDGDVPEEKDLIGADLYMKKMPECPAGGVYDFLPVGKVAVCTIAGHSLSGK